MSTRSSNVGDAQEPTEGATRTTHGDCFTGLPRSSNAWQPLDRPTSFYCDFATGQKIRRHRVSLEERFIDCSGDTVNFHCSNSISESGENHTTKCNHKVSYKFDPQHFGNRHRNTNIDEFVLELRQKKNQQDQTTGNSEQTSENPSVNDGDRVPGADAAAISHVAPATPRDDLPNFEAAVVDYGSEGGDDLDSFSNILNLPTETDTLRFRYRTDTSCAENHNGSHFAIRPRAGFRKLTDDPSDAQKHTVSWKCAYCSDGSQSPIATMIGDPADLVTLLQYAQGPTPIASLEHLQNVSGLTRVKSPQNHACEDSRLVLYEGNGSVIVSCLTCVDNPLYAIYHWDEW